MGKVEIELNRNGVRELLKSAEVAEMCSQIAERAASACGDGYEAQPRNYKDRTGAAVVAVSLHAKHDNSKNNTILKSLGG